MFVELPPPLSIAERADRAQWWIVHVPRLYRILRREPMGRRRAWRLATAAFHAWVWGWGVLPWEKK